MTHLERAQNVIDVSVRRLVGNPVADALVLLIVHHLRAVDEKAYARGIIAEFDATESLAVPRQSPTRYAQGFYEAQRQAMEIVEEDATNPRPVNWRIKRIKP